MKRSLGLLVVVCLIPLPDQAKGHSIRQKLGSYADNQGLVRRHISYDFSFLSEQRRGQLTGSTLDLSLSRDQYGETSITEDEYKRAVYGTRQQQRFGAEVATSQIWNRLGETRVLAAYNSDGQVSSRSWGVGASQWINHETIRLSIDLSRTLLERPFYGVLGYDSELEAAPTTASSTGATIGVRHLATPKIMIDYTGSYIHMENRPSTEAFGVKIRRFLPRLHAALHGEGVRVYNRGWISTKNTYGQVDAWIGELAWLQHLWQGAQGRVAYRYYREDEVTRVYQDHQVFGSDLITVSVSQKLEARRWTQLSGDLTIDGAASRYLTNTDVAARTFEAGVTAHF